MKTLGFILFNQAIRNRRRTIKRTKKTIFFISEVVVELCTLAALIISFVFRGVTFLYRKHISPVEEVIDNSNVIQFADCQAKKQKKGA